MDRKIASIDCRTLAYVILGATLVVSLLVFLLERDYWRNSVDLQSEHTIRALTQDLNQQVSLLQRVAMRCALGITRRDIIADSAGELARNPAVKGLACYANGELNAIVPSVSQMPADPIPPLLDTPDALRQWATPQTGTDLIWLSEGGIQRPVMVIRVRADPPIPRHPAYALVLLDVRRWVNVTLPSRSPGYSQLINLVFRRPMANHPLLPLPAVSRGIWPEAQVEAPISAIDPRWVVSIQAASRWAQYRGSLLVLVTGLLLTAIWMRRAHDMMLLDRSAYQTFVKSLSEMDLALVSIEQQRIRFVNTRLCDMTGLTSDELIDLPKFIFLFHPEERPRIMQNHLRRLAGEAFASHYDTALQSRDGRRIEVEMSVARLQMSERVVIMLLLRDISARKQAEAALLKHHEQLQSLVEAAPLPLVLTRLSDKAVLFTNHHASALFKVPMAEADHYRSVDFLVDDFARQDIRAQLRERGMLSDYEVRYRDAGGRIFWAMISAQNLSYADQPCVLVAINDITARREMHYQLEFLAHHDPLTNLPNRRLLLDTLQHEIAMADHGLVALLYLDLDGFKPINDTLGHENGDLALRLVSDRFKRCLRSTDLLARIGGDEFCVLIPSVQKPEDAASAAQNLLESLREPLQINQHQVQVGVSIGISIYPHDGRDAWMLLRAADVAMYEAKGLGKNNHRRSQPKPQKNGQQ